MTKQPLPTIEMLHKLLICDAEAGTLFWRERDVSLFPNQRTCNIWNTRFSGKQAFTCLASDGYLRGTIFNKKYAAHRVIWAMHTGAWPINQIDHDDRDRANNRFKNLKSSTGIENAKNKSISSNNTSGICGVSWERRRMKWCARISFDNRTVYLGSYDDIAEAAAIRKFAETKYGFHPNHGT